MAIQQELRRVLLGETVFEKSKIIEHTKNIENSCENYETQQEIINIVKNCEKLRQNQKNCEKFRGNAGKTWKCEKVGKTAKKEENSEFC